MYDCIGNPIDFEGLKSRIKSMRLSLGYSQEQVGICLGCSRQAICAYETGVSIPSIDTVAMYSKLFGISTDWILLGGKK